MKRIRIQFVPLALLLTTTLPALAANVWRGPYPVSSIINGPNGGFLLLLEASNPNCGLSGNQFNVNPGQNSVTADGVKAALAVALMAVASGRPISIVVDDTIAGCPVQQIRLDPL
jgi:hypothetical protein